MADPAGFWKPLSVWHLRISDLNFATVSLPIFTFSLRSDISDWTFFLASATATKFLLRRSSKSVVCLKFMFSKKATKIEEIFTVDLTLCSKCQIDGEGFVNFCGLLRKHELCTPITSMA